MKRSEIIRLIQKEIYSITQDDILYDSFSFSRNLLDKLESAGMLPPTISKNDVDVLTTDGKSINLSVNIHEWETE